MLRHLHRWHEIHYVAIADPAYHLGIAYPEQAEGPARAHEYSSKAYPVPYRIPEKFSQDFLFQLAMGMFSPTPLAVSRFRPRFMRQFLKRLIRQERFDRAVVDHLAPTAYFPDLPHAIFFQHNVETMIWRRHVEQSPDPVRKTYFKIQANRMFDWERRMCQAAGRVVAVSPQDAATMQAMFAIDAVSVPTGVDLDYFRRPPDPQRTADLVFVGSMDWLPNSDGVNYFVRDVLPLIWQRKKDCTLAVVGRNPSPAMLARAREDSRIQVTGTVPDVRPWLWGASVSIVPLRIGGGTRLKIYEAMAAGTATVSTSIGAEGLDVAHPANIRLADTSRNFAEECLTLLQDASQRQATAAHALELVTSRFSWDVVTAEFEKLLVVGARPGAEVAGSITTR